MAFLTYPRFILFARTFLVPGLMLMQAETILSSTLFLSGWLGPNTFYKSIKVGSPEKAGIKPTTSRPCANSANHMSNHHRSQLSLRPMPSYYIDLMGAIFSYSSCFNSYVTLVYQAGCQVQQKKGTFFSIFAEARKKDTGVDCRLPRLKCHWKKIGKEHCLQLDCDRKSKGRINYEFSWFGRSIRPLLL